MAYKKILIVDDEKNLTTALDSFFRAKGHDIYIANSGEAALDFLKKERIDLLLLDINMPGVDGVEVAKTVKRIYPDTKILILTAYSEEYKEKLASIKQEAIMAKPFGVLTLINKVEELLGERVTPLPKPEGLIKFRPVRVLFIDPSVDYAGGYILRDYVLPYIRLTWGRNIEVEAISAARAVKEKIISFKPDIVLLSTVLKDQAKQLSEDIANDIYNPKEIILYNMPDEETAKKSPAVAYYDMQASLMDPAYLNRLNELIKEVALKHKLIDEGVFKKERPAPPPTLTLDDIADFVKKAIKETLSLKEIELKDNTSFVEDLGVDSLETVELTMALEETFGFELPDEHIEKLRTVGDAIEYIKKRVNLEELTRRKKASYRLLIIDDQEGMCKFLENYFLSKGYEAQSTTEAQEALSLVKKENPDIVLLDIRMPQMDGIEVLKSIKEQSPSTKVIMVSVASEREPEAQRCGADAFISKPFPITYLEETVIKKIKELTEQK